MRVDVLKTMTGAFVIAGLLLAVSTPVSAVAIFVANHSFEEPPGADGTFTSGALGDLNPVPGWVAVADTGVFNPTSVQLSQGPTDGSQVGYSNNTGLAMTQVLGVVVLPNTLYTLKVDLQSRTDGFTHKATTLELRTADDDILATASFDALSGGLNQELTATFLAGAADPHLGETLKIALSAGGSQSDWDNVRLDATLQQTEPPVQGVPEPATMTLLTLGSTLLAVARRRRAP